MVIDAEIVLNKEVIIVGHIDNQYGTGYKVKDLKGKSFILNLDSENSKITIVYFNENFDFYVTSIEMNS